MKKRRVNVVGLTGGAGSGKTEAAHFFSELGFEVISLDEIGRELSENDDEIKLGIIHGFGDKIFDENGEIIREKLRDIVFSNHDAMRRLDRIYYSRFDEVVGRRVDEFLNDEKRSKKPIIIDGAILHDAGLDKYVDFSILVKSESEIQAKRLMKRMGISKKSALKLLEIQMEKLPNENEVDLVIRNVGTLSELRERVFFIGENIIS